MSFLDEIVNLAKDPNLGTGGSSSGTTFEGVIPSGVYPASILQLYWGFDKETKKTDTSTVQVEFEIENRDVPSYYVKDGELVKIGGKTRVRFYIDLKQTQYDTDNQHKIRQKMIAFLVQAINEKEREKMLHNGEIINERKSDGKVNGETALKGYKFNVNVFHASNKHRNYLNGIREYDKEAEVIGSFNGLDIKENNFKKSSSNVDHFTNSNTLVMEMTDDEIPF